MILAENLFIKAEPHLCVQVYCYKTCTPSILMTTCRIFSSQKNRISKIAFSDYLTSHWYKTFKNMFHLCNFSVFEWFYYNNWWCIFRPTQIRYTPLLTYAKSAILHIRPSSTWFYSCYTNTKKQLAWVWYCSRSEVQ